MFVRIRKRQLKKGFSSYAYLVDNQWNPFRKKHQQKIITCLGRVADLPANGVIEKIIVALDKFAQKMGYASLANGIILSDLGDEKKFVQAYDWGSLLLTKHLLGILSFKEIIRHLAKRSSTKAISLKRLLTAVNTLLAHRLTDHPFTSELATLSWYQEKVYLFPKIKLTKDDFYRSLDFLIGHKEAIERQYYQRNKNLFSQGLDLVLFDTTSVYYWGEKGEAAKRAKNQTEGFSALLQYGFSKDHRSDLKQLIVGILMTEEGVPIAHEVFPGNQLDLISFPQIIKKVKKKYSLKRVIFIADKGMVSEDNLRSLEEQEMEYLLGVRMRKLPPALKKILACRIDQDSMKKIKDSLFAQEFKIKDFLKPGSIWLHPTQSNKSLTGKKIIEELVNSIYKNLDFYRSRTGSEKKDKASIRKRILKRRYFVCFNPLVAKENQRKRKYFKKIIQNKIKYTQNKDWIVKNGYKKYLKFQNLDPQLDEEKLDQEKFYDGKWILLTNSPTISPQLAAIRYKSLRFIEQGFKDLKSLIHLRPIYHFKEERIKAHVFVCFLALILKWYVYQKLDAISQIPGRHFLKQMNNLKAIAIDPAIPLHVRTAVSPETQALMKKLKMKVPGKVILDGRKKPNPISHKPGRPRKHQSPNQLPLPKSVV